MEALILLAILLGGVYFVVLPILLLVNWARTSTQAGQLANLQRALQEANKRQAALEARLQAGAPSATPQPEKAAPEADRPQTLPLVAPKNIATRTAEPLAPPLQPVTRALPETTPEPDSTLAQASHPVPANKPIPAAAIEQITAKPLTPATTAGNPATPATPAPPAPAAADNRPVQADNATTAAATAPKAQPAAPVAVPAAPRPRPRPTPAKPAAPAEPGILERAFGAAKDWLFGGNTLVRVGMLLVFLGLAFALRLAAENAVLPLEVRYLGVAACALVALTLGWRLRLKRPAYALLMQGGAVAVMYLTVFAALKLHDHPLLPTQAGLFLLVATVVLSGILAVTQDSLALAAAGALGGFAAPVLVSTGGGSHVALFTYFALLNTGILGVAWFKAWRPLNLIGFAGTFLIGLAWGQRSYDPVLHYANTQPFLILFFLMFVAIGLLFARRVLLDDPATPTSRNTAEWAAWFAAGGHKAQRYVDGTLLFGTPIVAFGLQYALIRHIEYGAAFSALALGMFYMSLAFILQKANALRHRLLTEVFLALGVIFASLAIPLGLDAQWTSAAWAVEAAGIYWIGHRQQRPLARAFAVLLQIAATLAYSQKIVEGTDTLLAGPVLGALMLGLSFLSNLWVLRKYASSNNGAWDSGFETPFGTLALWALYLIAPLTLSTPYAAAALALAGTLTVFIGLRLRLRGWIGNALLVQLVAGIVFLGSMHAGDAGGVLALNGSGLKGLIIAALIGLSSLTGLGVAIREARRQNNPQLVTRLAWAMLFGLGFIVLAVLFVLPWQTATAVWAGCGFVLMWAARRLELRPAFWFALALEVVAGLAFLSANWGALNYYGVLAVGDEANPFAHAGFWTPIVISLATFAMAWRLFAWERTDTESEDTPPEGNWLSLGTLLWSVGWWVFAWFMELHRTNLEAHEIAHDFLAAMALGLALALPIAARWRWQHLAGILGGILPLIALTAIIDYQADVNLLSGKGWAVYACAILGGILLLRVAGQLLSRAADAALHLMSCWVWLICASLELRYLFLTLGEPGSTWRWLGWTLPLVAWLLWQARTAKPRLWPAAAHPQTWRFNATLPVLAILLLWAVLANFGSGGNAAPLPFIPLVNPLDIALVLVLFAGWQWTRQLAAQEPAECLLRPFSGILRLALLGIGFITYSCIVLRGAHHLGGIPWNAESLMASMLVQASMSIFWSLLALGMMIAGHRTAHRSVWISGAVLVGVVVIKLFFIELSNHGGLARIISFIGVGVLLLVVGYFAPLPPSEASKQSDQTDPDTHADHE